MADNGAGDPRNWNCDARERQLGSMDMVKELGYEAVFDFRGRKRNTQAVRVQFKQNNWVNNMFHPCGSSRICTPAVLPYVWRHLTALVDDSTASHVPHCTSTESKATESSTFSSYVMQFGS